MNKILFPFLLLLCSFSFAQQFSGNPPSYKWQQLKTDTVRVIFPKGMDSIAAQIASVIHFEQRKTAGSIGSNIKPIDIVLQNAPTYSNAYVQLAPRRSEFFLTPLQNNFNLGITPWYKTLAVHEYRHVMQYNNFNKGLSKAATFILGQEGQELLNNAAVPNWFWEGDAVYYETALTNNGRGRIPYFFNQYKSLWAADKNYSYMKLRNGSMKDFIPSHYHFGYMMVAYGRMKYGEDFWKQVTADAVRFKGLFYPFQKAVEKYSKQDYKTFYKEAFSYFKQQSSLTANEPNELQLTQPQHNTVHDYYAPYFMDDDKLIAYKESYSKVPGFYIIQSGKEEKIKSADFLSDEYFDYRNNTIVYATYKPDIRWTYHTYSNIKILDILSGKAKEITKNSRYFSPSFSAKADKIVSVHVPVQGKSELHILDATNGNIENNIPNNSNLFYTYPRFYNDKTIIAAVRDTTGKMAVGLIDIQTGNCNFITPLSNTVVSTPFVVNDTIYFTASYRNADNVFAFVDNRIYQITHTGIGNYQPSVYKNRVVYQKRTADGLMLAQKPVEFTALNESDKNALFEIQNLYIDKNLSAFNDDKIQHATPVNATITKYPKLKGFFNLHSMRPYYDQPEWSFTIYGENVLNTVQTQLRYIYNENEGSHTVSFNELIGTWYPVITTGMNYTIDRYALTNTNNIFYYDELNLNAGLLVPFNLTKGNKTSFLQLGSTYNIEKIFLKGIYKNQSIDAFTYLNSFLSYTIASRMAVQHIAPRLSFSINSRLRNSVSNLTAQQWLTNASINLPSFAQTHHFSFTGSYQRRDTANQYLFSNNFPFSRGYVYTPNYPVMYKTSVNYLMPLVYPDFGLAQLIYINRIRTTLFYDHTTGKSLRTGLTRAFSSAGSELWFDTKLWNHFPLSIGLRYSRLLDTEFTGTTNADRFELLIPLTFL